MRLEWLINMENIKHDKYDCIRPENNERKLFLSLTEQGEALKEKAKDVPAAMQGCIPLEQEA